MGPLGLMGPMGLMGAYGANRATRANEANRANKANERKNKTMKEAEEFLPKKGNYRGLIVYQKAECIYDITFYFAHTYMFERKDRTVDQMVQAARSGKQNIAEGCAAAPTSAETELKLNGVARASMKELLMMGKYMARLQKDFVEKGGIREQMTAARLGYRGDQKARIAELEAENARLRERIAELERQLAEKGGGK